MSEGLHIFMEEGSKVRRKDLWKVRDKMGRNEDDRIDKSCTYYCPSTTCTSSPGPHPHLDTPIHTSIFVLLIRKVSLYRTAYCGPSGVQGGVTVQKKGGPTVVPIVSLLQRCHCTGEPTAVPIVSLSQRFHCSPHMPVRLTVNDTATIKQVSQVWSKDSHHPQLVHCR